MNRRTRNRICIWIIFFGLVNFVTYAVIYAELGGDASNGYIGTGEDGRPAYYVAGHFIHGREGQYSRVAPWVWIYSYVHSISIWPTEAAVLVCLLILGRPHIIATMKEDGLMQGSTFVAVCSTIVILLASALTIWFVIRFVSQLTSAGG